MALTKADLQAHTTAVIENMNLKFDELSLELRNTKQLAQEKRIRGKPCPWLTIEVKISNERPRSSTSYIQKNKTPGRYKSI